MEPLFINGFPGNLGIGGNGGSTLDPECVEIDPTGRYFRVSSFIIIRLHFFIGIRIVVKNDVSFGTLDMSLIWFNCCLVLQYKEILGTGAFKTV
ncbi:hypothetical protein GW17_00058659 [Ensete ventricosum]|uniref:Uncharacterized protein n=1 Tax=Ensete ventricosum TaxID=4639 RepID=A0A444C2N5_ENSVE|nr:hypothetical protein GW17_00058659 [Ensete ventricosum]RZR73914.1 hypothetical protein BHM03_00029616 [Ensete ventricosum]